MKEKQLRKIVKDIFEAGSNSHLGLQWVEPSQGSSVGMPDVYWPYKGQLIGIELKVWTDKVYLRPAQYAYHRNSAKDGIPSFVFGVCAQTHKYPNKFEFTRTYDLFIIDGALIENYKDMPTIQLPFDGNTVGVDCIMDIPKLNDYKHYDDIIFAFNIKLGLPRDYVWIDECAEIPDEYFKRFKSIKSSKEFNDWYLCEPKPKDK